MAKRKPNKISTGEAVKILANEMKQLQQTQNQILKVVTDHDYMIKDYSALFEQYIGHTKDGKSFIKKMEKLIEEKVNEQKANEQADGLDTDGDSKDERVGAEGVRAQEG